MKGTVVAVTKERNELKEKEVKVFSGKMAGICYMADEYFNSNVTNEEKAEDRFNRVIKTGHHSIAEHYKVTLLLEGIPKMLAIILNSLCDYCTSEKSGRYTVMKGRTEEEVRLYNKWLNIIVEEIKNKYPNIEERQRQKLGQENARYMMSVFTPATTLSYTTSIRQWNYIKDWCYNTSKKINNKTENYFNRNLKETLLSLAKIIEDTGLVLKDEENKESIEEFKGRGFELLALQEDNLYSRRPKEQYGASYTLNYKTSFVSLADSVRHRTLDYFMRFDGNSEEFFVPYILNDKLKEEWLNDIKSVAEYIPIGTLVDITETGNIMNFTLKLKERICGRVQIEVGKQINENLMKIYTNTEDILVKDMLNKYLVIDGVNIRAKAKCELLSKCKEGCVHGACKAVDRYI